MVFFLLSFQNIRTATQPATNLRPAMTWLYISPSVALPEHFHRGIQTIKHFKRTQLKEYFK